MLRMTNYTTWLLVLIIIILLIGVGVAIYYVLDLDWFDNKGKQEIPKEVVVYTESYEYDMTKRIYNITVSNNELEVIVYKDGSVGVKLLSNKYTKDVKVYKEIIDKEIKTNVANITKAYIVKAAKNNKSGNYLVLLDKAGNLYKLDNEKLKNQGMYDFIQIRGLGKIVDIKQITSDNVVDNPKGINVIAIDNEKNELLLTDYLVENK